jgi:hypothetical protein
MVLKLEHFVYWIRSALKVLKCGVGEGWGRADGVIVWEIKKYYIRNGEC